MAILEILQYPDPRLYTPAERVENIDALGGGIKPGVRVLEDLENGHECLLIE